MVRAIRTGLQIGEGDLHRDDLAGVAVEVFAKTAWQVSIEADTPQRHEGHRGVLLIGEPAAPA